MTPAEKPSDRERNDVLVRLAKKAMALPMPVECQKKWNKYLL